ncbi:hypothetical protein, partial [Halochromatium glycolicum]
MPTITFRDRDGSGALVSPTGPTGSVDYVSNDFSVFPYGLVPIKIPLYEREDTGTRTEGNQIITEWRRVLTGFEDGLAGYLYEGGAVTASYLPADHVGTPASETLILNDLRLDLTPGYNERIVRGSLRFRFGSSLYVDQAGLIYRD